MGKFWVSWGNPFRCTREHGKYIPVEKWYPQIIPKDDLDKSINEMIEKDPYFAAVYKAARDDYQRNSEKIALLDLADALEEDKGDPMLIDWIKTRAEELYG